MQREMQILHVLHNGTNHEREAGIADKITKVLETLTAQLGSSTR
jgi:hypothetical protein